MSKHLLDWIIIAVVWGIGVLTHAAFDKFLDWRERREVRRELAVMRAEEDRRAAELYALLNAGARRS